MFPPAVSRAALEAAGVPITVVEGAHDLPLLDPRGCADALLAAVGSAVGTPIFPTCRPNSTPRRSTS
jgi:hypothetical protein